MKCEDALLLISGHIDGENTPQEAQLLQEHLADCEACRAVLEAWTEVDMGIASLTEEAPADLCEKVMASIGAPKKKQRWLPVLAAAAAVALVIGLGSGHMPAMQQEEAVPMVARTMDVEFAVPANFFRRSTVKFFQMFAELMWWRLPNCCRRWRTVLMRNWKMALCCICCLRSRWRWN